MSYIFPPFSYPSGYSCFAPFELVRIVKIPLAPNIKTGAKVLVLTDTAMDQRVWEAIAQATTDLGGEPTIAMFSPRPADGWDPPSNVGLAMLGSELNVLVASTAMLHCKASAAAMEKGIPSLALGYGMTAEQLCQGGALANWDEVEEYRKKITENYRGKEAHLTSEAGTDLIVSIEGRSKKYTPVDIPYRIGKRYGGKLYGDVFPQGEVNIAPVEGTANGIVIIDVSMHIIKNRWLDRPIKLTIKNSQVTEIEGGHDAEALRNFLKRYGDDNGYYCPAELSVGCNPAARFIGNQKEDKNVLGSVHVGIGTNEDVGGTVRSSVHLDGVISNPTLAIDGRPIVERGMVVI